MKTSLYNPDGTLSIEAQSLLSSKPDDMSISEWRKIIKQFKSQLSEVDIKKFKRLQKKKHRAKNNADWINRNPEKAKKSQRKSSAKWKTKNPEKVKEGNLKWKAENVTHVNNYMNNYHKQRRVKDPIYRLQQNMRSACQGIIKRLSLGKKPACTFQWIGCSPEELKSYLESLFIEGMTWENYGEWHVDHIRPVCSFSAEEWEQVNHFTNLRPLWAEDNFSKIVSDKQQKKLRVESLQPFGLQRLL